MNKINSLIIGMGAIGYSYDNYFKNSYCMTHLSALQANRNIKNIYCSDKKKFNLKNTKKVIFASHNLKALMNIDIGLIVISTPTKIHYQSFKKVISILKPKIILLEKPGTFSHREYKKIWNKCNKEGVVLICNYYRNFDLFFNNLLKFFDKKNNEIIIRYSKDIYTHLPHFINFINFIAKGDYKIIMLSKGKLKKEKNINFLISYKNCNIYVLHNKENKNEMIVENNKFSIISSENFNCFNILYKKKSIIFKDKHYVYKSNTLKNKNKNKYQKTVYDKIFKSLTNKKYIYRLNKNSYNTLKILNSIEKR
jgi:hypothetical protein